jgi:hypothetical protein
VILDPPYNLTKNYNGHIFQAKEAEAYRTWFDDVLSSLVPLLRPRATVYACSDSHQRARLGNHAESFRLQSPAFTKSSC